jgi:hypothetical protein
MKICVIFAPSVATSKHAVWLAQLSGAPAGSPDTVTFAAFTAPLPD